MVEQKVEILDFNLKSNVSFLSNVKGFQSADSSVIQSIAQLMQKQKWPSKKNIFQEGEPAEALYIIDSGTVNIIKDGETIVQLHEGNFFGEIGILEASVRSASVETDSECIIYLVPGFTLKDLAQNNAVFEKFFNEIILARK